MRTFRDAKAMAKSLRTALAQKNLELTHSECLELVANQFGFDDWNILSARIETDDSHTRPATDAVAFSDAIPILRIFDVAKAMEFYRDFLGFTLDWEHRYAENAPLYAQMSRAGIRLHLSEHHGDASPGSTVFVWMRGIRAYHEELLGKRYRYNRPGLEDAGWDAWVMEVNDPFGNKLRFSEPYAADDPRA
jgi:hypothetical protein